MKETRMTKFAAGINAAVREASADGVTIEEFICVMGSAIELTMTKAFARNPKLVMHELEWMVNHLLEKFEGKVQ